MPAALARERERFGAYATRTMGGNLLADLVQEEVRRRERIVAIDSDTVLVHREGSSVILEPIREWPAGYVESFAGIPEDFERPPQGKVEKRRKL